MPKNPATLRLFLVFIITPRAVPWGIVTSGLLVPSSWSALLVFRQIRRVNATQPIRNRIKRVTLNRLQAMFNDGNLIVTECYDRNERFDENIYLHTRFVKWLHRRGITDHRRRSQTSCSYWISCLRTLVQWFEYCIYHTPRCSPHVAYVGMWASVNTERSCTYKNCSEISITVSIYVWIMQCQVILENNYNIGLVFHRSYYRSHVLLL